MRCPSHGPLLAWLEAQLHEHGPVTWNALQTDLANHPSREWATQLMATAHLDGQPAEDMATELRDLLNRMLVEHIEKQKNEASAAAATDPQAFARYRELDERWRKLKSAIT